MSALTGISGMISFDADVTSTEAVDWIGASLITVGLVLIVFVLGQGQIAPQGWKTPCKTSSVSRIANFHNHYQTSSFFLSSDSSWFCCSCFGSDTWS
jgi:hypothetical protein